MKTKLSTAIAIFLLAVMSGCATGPNTHPRDPMEPLNRAVFGFNEAVDQAVLRPTATAYDTVVPDLARAGISNFFANIGDAWSVVNNALQGKGQDTSDSFGRLLINSTVGMAGLFDVASQAGIERHPQDFGQTLGHWGMGSGPYVVLPLLGSSTLRDTAALPLDYKGDLVHRLGNIPLRNSATALRIVDQRAALLGASKIIDDAALDKYTFVRDAHLQRRDHSIAPLDGDKDHDSAQDQESKPDDAKLGASPASQDKVPTPSDSKLPPTPAQPN
jgi:phospholipid-binding lipoprotein MlaA